MLSHETWGILSNDLIRRVFNEVVENRSISLRDLVNRLSRSQRSLSIAGGVDETVRPDLPKEDIESALDYLENQGLIKKKGSAVDDLTTYYVTSDGLQAERQMRRH